ncbi:folate-binding protein YgfZ [Aeromicrobium sp. Leaf350]|uniref:CAF17-like 4Fe-4S cluster assembly/insertion protein YgfZ n=1 Tax=Aeromicrobium sp. Leaf350 TaxID=2876565 RepID=UPI001E64FEDC|nr:folate-binding protein [Aeromicrobium sp. Leaf350]
MSAYESRRSPLLDLPGAVFADAPDSAVAAHYGSIVNEQRRFEAGGTFVDLSHRDVLTISGPDRLTWLHDLSTQHVRDLAPGVATSALILSPQGRIEHGFDLVDDGETVWAHTEPGAAAPLVAFLDRMRFMTRVEVREVTDEHAVIGLPGLAWQIRPRATLADLPAELGDPVGTWAWEAARIADGRARVGLDTDELTIPNEAGLLDVAVHLDKGCYRGQETVARVHTLGRPPRRLTLLHLDGSVDHLPAVGSEVTADGRKVGTVGTSARHHELGPIALALLKRSVDLAAPLLVDGVAAAQEVVVDPEVGLHVRPSVRG